MPFTSFINCRVCREGRLIADQRITVSSDTGRILKSAGDLSGDIVDLNNTIIAPGFLELQMNGLFGFHFTDFKNEEQYGRDLAKVARRLVERGCTGFWAILPTVEARLYQKVSSNSPD